MKVSKSVLSLKKELALISICAFSSLAFPYRAVASVEDVHSKVSYIQNLVVPLQRGAANILQVYSDYYQVNNFDPKRPLSKNLVKRLENDISTFFSEYDQAIELSGPLISPSKTTSCQESLTKFDRRFVSPLKKQAKDIETVKYGMRDNFAYLFLSTAQGLSSILISDRCL